MTTGPSTATVTTTVAATPLAELLMTPAMAVITPPKHDGTALTLREN